eukprot:CAMPEP_0175973842 /NCGR_PEP_ID=MMETSP0108-20121206/43040_1 /TAXON_ID=195067 ORGANISM="Goniomonas pacifica, Strain CCMP1869" /NCGR_SAMPLE_ID=MMETSP0108 /ASSEMBLY_ACC=CAM_ASM_000204 /LENGTH=44 /DNA_ID= /DNA_START= /DNA_END= /DNA_ORIENTATION=
MSGGLTIWFHMKVKGGDECQSNEENWVDLGSDDRFCSWARDRPW